MYTSSLRNYGDTQSVLAEAKSKRERDRQRDIERLQVKEDALKHQQRTFALPSPVQIVPRRRDFIISHPPADTGRILLLLQRVESPFDCASSASSGESA